MAGAIDHRLDGALRVGAHSRPRHSRGHRIDPDQRQPRAAAARDAETAILGDLHRLGRTVRSRRTDHHDRRSVRLDDRAVVSPDQRRAEDAAGRGRGGGHVRDLCRARRRRAARGGVVAVRMEAAQPDSRRAGQRDRRRGAPYLLGLGPAVSRSASSGFHRPRGAGRLRVWRDCWRHACPRC